MVHFCYKICSYFVRVKEDNFQTMSDQIIGRIDDMAARIDDLEHNINDLMVQSGQGDQHALQEPK